MTDNISITRRFIACIIDIIIALILALVLFFLFAALFGPIVTNSGYYVGAINRTYSELTGNPYTNVSEAVSGELWTIIIYVLSFSISQLVAEFKFSASIGIKLLGGIVMNKDNKPITKSEIIRRYFARVIYLPTVFYLFTHIFDIRPTFAIVFISVITFVCLMRDQRNVIEKITSTHTAQRLKNEVQIHKKE